MEDTDDLKAQLDALTDIHEMKVEIARLEERMETAFERLRGDIAHTQTRLMIAVIGTVGVGTAIIGVGIAVVGFLIGLPQ